MARPTLNTISRGFPGEGETNLAKKRYVQSVMHVSQNLFSEKEERLVDVSFLRWDSEVILVHENDPMVIKVQIHY